MSEHPPTATGHPRGGDAVPGAVDPAVLSVAAETGPPTLAVRRDGDGVRLTWANEAARTLLEITAADPLGYALATVVPVRQPGPADWTTVVSEILGHRQSARLGLWHSACVDHPDPSRAGVQVRVADAGGGAFVVSLRAVEDDQRVAEEAARESEHRFHALAEHAPVGILVSESGVRLGFVNSRFVDITGVERRSLLGTQWLTAIHPEDLPGLLDTLDTVLAGVAAETRLRLVPVADTQRWVELRLAPVQTPRRAAGFIATVEDISARRAWETQLAYQAGHDALTGLANRRALVEALSVALTSRRLRARDAAVLFCDLDGFKQINDSLGHEAGDRVLIEVAQRLAGTARDHDLVARIAGDEFVVVLGEVASHADAEAAATRQLDALAQPFLVAGEAVRLSASIGIALVGEYETPTLLLQAADRGMYQAKRQGGGRFVSDAAGADGQEPRP